MTKARYKQILLDLSALRRRDGETTEQLRQALHDFFAAVFAQRVRLAKRSSITRNEIRKFAPTPAPWRGYFLLAPGNQGVRP